MTGRTRRIRAVGAPLSLVLMALVILAPTAAAYTYGGTPPWPQGTHWYNESGGWNGLAKGIVVAYSPLTDSKTYGTGSLNYEVLASGAQGIGLDMGIQFWQIRFTPLVSGSHDINIYWTVSGHATADSYAGWPAGFSEVKNFINAYAQVYQVSTWYPIQTGPATVPIWNVDYVWWHGDISVNQVYDVRFPAANLYAGSTYEIWTWVGFYMSAASSFASIAWATQAFSVKLGSYNVYGPGGGGGSCVLAGTRITLSDGTNTPVDKLKPGDQVMGYDFATGRQVPVQVTSNTRTVVNQVEVINDGLLSVTLNDQPLYVRNGTWEGWVRNPSDLRTGMELFQPATQQWIKIYSIRTDVGSYKVYDLVTSPLNNFIANGVLADRK